MNPGGAPGEDTRPEVPVLLGPTGAGKTELLEQIDPDRVEIISCDSRQIYRELEIGSAAPEPWLTARLRHHLVGILDPTEEFNAARFRDRAVQAINEVFARGRLPFVVGGSGFYFRALHTGLFAIDVSPQTQAEARTRVAALTPPERLSLLRELDPGALVSPGENARAGRVHPNDDYRVSRALEICLAGGGTFSGLWDDTRRRAASGELAAASAFRFSGWRLEVEPESYWRRLAGRAQAMVAQGVADEAGRVWERYGPCPGLETLGYDHALAAYRGEIDANQLGEQLFISHRQYGKRQRTWLRREGALAAIRREELVPILAGRLRELSPQE